ncbi:MAG TPA: cytosine permease [Bryobacteraceae bacterium]|nr:cytosine permease [Bryobacteraceae bacterium]
MLPDYIAKAVPNPAEKRAPWYANTAPAYAGIFLWVAFYRSLADGTLDHGSLAVCLAGLVFASALCYLLYYLAPAMLGMKTGFPLYVIGSSTFGTAGGYLMPGLLMGLLQIGWFAVATSIASEFVLKAVGADSTPMSVPFIVTGVVWGGVFAWVGAKGIQYVAKVSTLLNFIPLLMLIVVYFQAPSGQRYTPPPAQTDPYVALTMVMAAVIGFFATAGAAGADFGINARHERDVRWGGLVGVMLAPIVAGGLALMAVSAAAGSNPKLPLDYANVLQGIGGPIATSMFVLFAIASIPATCFCIFIAGNSFSTMIPGVPRVSSSMAAGAAGIVLAVTGVATHLISFFSIVGASFGPICGAIAADYLLSGKKWAGPREGINWAGYISWAVGFVVGILPFLPLDAATKRYVQPAALYSFVAGFVVYAALAKMGLEPKVVEMKGAAKAA